MTRGRTPRAHQPWGPSELRGRDPKTHPLYLRRRAQPRHDLYTSITGGCDNLAGTTGTVKAEPCNTSGAQFASVSGGEDNKVTSPSASVSGGGYNTASGEGSSVSAGSGNTAGGGYSSVSGGYSSQAESSWDSVSGGVFNVAKGTEKLCERWSG